jgi:hypothetical protein
MTSDTAQARRVHETGLPLHDRLLALRECVLHFAPYGFRATWHHLLASARVPRQLTDDPDSLLRAADELQEAHVLWRAHSEAFTARRRQAKAAGRRTPKRTERWYASAGRIAYCPDPLVHPRERLAVVLQRVIEAYSSDSDWDAACPVCHQERSATETCRRCGVDPRGSTAPVPHDVQARLAHEWREIWHRTAHLEAGS